MLVREFLRKAPVTVPPQCSLAEAARLMSDHNVGALLVMSGEKIIGIVTDRDITVRGVGSGRDLESAIADVMTEHPITIEGSADIFDAYRLLKEARVRRLPVVEEGELGGIVTMDDLLIALVLEFGAVVSPAASEVLGSEATS